MAGLRPLHLQLGLHRRNLLRGNAGPIRHLAWCPRGEALAAGCSNGSVLVWRTEDEPLPPFHKHEQPVVHVAWSPDGKALASASEDRTIVLWDVQSGRWQTQIDTMATPAGLTWSPDGGEVKALFVAEHQSEPRAAFHEWNASDGSGLGAKKYENWELASVAISSDKSLVVVALRNTSLQVWDLARARCIAELRGDGREVHSVALAPDRRTLAIGFHDGLIRIWDLWEERPPWDIQASALAVRSIAFSATGGLFASKTGDGRIAIRCWRTRTTVATLTESFPTGGVPELAFHPELPRMAVLEELGTAIRIWDFDSRTLCLFGEGKMIPILFMAADPTDSGMDRLSLAEELRGIQDRLQAANLRELFDLKIRMAVRLLDLQHALLAVKPTIVQFSGHGSKAGKIIIDDGDGHKHEIHPGALAEMFGLVSDHVQCVVLNACYSEHQARAIAKSVDFVIGMSDRISDESSILFSASFYLALGEGSSFEHAFRVARNALHLDGTPDHLMPVLIKRRARKRRQKIEARPDLDSRPASSVEV